MGQNKNGSASCKSKMLSLDHITCMYDDFNHNVLFLAVPLQHPWLITI